MDDCGKPESKPITTKIPWTCADSLDLPTADWSIELTHHAVSGVYSLANTDGTMRVRFWGAEAEAMSAAIIDLDLRHQVTILHDDGVDLEMYLKSWTYSKALHGFDNLLVVWDLVVAHA
jgi:hypothetical protein